MRNKRIFTLITCLMMAAGLMAQNTATDPDFMDSIGKIYVVVAVILVIFFGIIIFLIRLDRKIARLENQIIDND